MNECSRGDGRPSVAKGLCRSCYNTDRQREKRAAVRAEERGCLQCGGSLAGRRPNTVYCSREHAEAHRAAQRHETMLERFAARRCVVCDGPIESMSGKAETCSPECSQRMRNMRRQEARRAAAPPITCPCGKSVEGRRLGARYCSDTCKNREGAARWRERAPDYMRGYLYGMAAGDFDRMLAEQGGGCAICRTREWPGHGNRPHVDHDHATGAVRGILCGSCNQGLGRFNDDPTRLRAAADYLERFRT